MSRSRWIVLAVALACSTLGCAHIGHQDEMPAPCAAGGCGDYGPIGTILTPSVVEAPVMIPANAPTVLNSSPAPPSAGTAGSAPSGGPSVPDPLPVPGNGAAPFSTNPPK